MEGRIVCTEADIGKRLPEAMKGDNIDGVMATLRRGENNGEFLPSYLRRFLHIRAKRLVSSRFLWDWRDSFLAIYCIRPIRPD